MKKLSEVLQKFLTPEQQEAVKGYYIVNGSQIHRIAEEIPELTVENFKVIKVNYNEDDSGQVVVATAEDIAYYNPDNKDYDFIFKDTGDYFVRDDAPSELVAFLDKVLKKSDYECQSGDCEAGDEITE